MRHCGFLSLSIKKSHHYLITCLHDNWDLTPYKGGTKGIRLPLMEAMLVEREDQSQLAEEVHDHPNEKLRFKGKF